MSRLRSVIVPVILGIALLLGSLVILLVTRTPARQAIRVTAVIKAIVNDSEFWEMVKAGMRTAADDFGLVLDIQGPWAESDIDGQIRIVEEILSGSPPKALILAATDHARLAPLVEQAWTLGIKVIALDSGVDSSRPATFVATNNQEAAEKAALEMQRLLQSRRLLRSRGLLEGREPGKVAIINHVRGATTAIERENGVRRALDAATSDGDCTIIGAWFTDNFEENAYAITVNLLAEYPDLAGILAMNEVSTVGAARALRDLELGGRIPLVGFDSSIAEVQFIEEGIIAATVIQKPFNMGYLAVRAARDAMENRALPDFIDTGSVLITAENLYEPENQKLLFPF
ncbi:MAG: substrate-binding domain-containing protein [Treponema sp.]|nr:substrate-binding domain-containing protein [Treponema sp.]